MSEYATGVNAPIATAQAPLPGIDAPQPAVHSTIAAVIGATQATLPPESWAHTAAALLQALQPEINAGLQLSRASAKTQATVGLAEASIVSLAGLLQLFFPHPKG